MKKAFVLLSFSLALQSCISYSAITPQEYDQLVGNARLFALQNIELNDVEKSKLEMKPKFGYYYMGDKYGQFFITWPLDSKRELVVRGFGYMTKADSLDGVIITDTED
jgi:hypothetical protein